MPSLVCFTTELRYAEFMSLLKGHEDVLRKITGEEPKDKDKWLIPGLKIERKQQKELVIVDPNRTAYQLQEPSSLAHAAELAKQRFDIVEKAFGIPKLVRWGCRTQWIEPLEDDINKATSLFKSKVFGAFIPSKLANDVGISLDHKLDDKGTLVHVTSGPMEPKQLKDMFLPWGTNALPPAFIFIDIDLSWREPVSFSTIELAKFIKKGCEIGEEYSSRFIEGFKGS